ncbi:uncharacterized protein LOC125456289 [Stegostoma tigrinum]|uniref:uncharacterized protein LOC125456289 n=1 Tax=Stegostoma tigrinum TaxID=3053191 RepID=UPI0028707DD1|nr:uncharacterized protein LOC125456289 [Stegostoma tigrinum]
MVIERGPPTGAEGGSTSYCVRRRRDLQSLVSAVTACSDITGGGPVLFGMDKCSHHQKVGKSHLWSLKGRCHGPNALREVGGLRMIEEESCQLALLILLRPESQILGPLVGCICYKLPLSETLRYIEMAESDIVPGGQRLRLRERRSTAGPSADRKETRGWGSAGQWEDDVCLASSKNQPGPGAPALPTDQLFQTCARSLGRAAIPQAEGRDCPDPGVGREHRQAQKDRGPRCTYLTDSVLGYQEPPVDREGKAPKQGTNPGLTGREWPGMISLGDVPWPTREKPPLKLTAKTWRPPKGFWKVLRRETAPLGKRPGTFHDVIAQEKTGNANTSEHLSSHSSVGSRATPEGWPGADVLQRSATGPEKWSACRLGQLEALWKTDSWESVGSHPGLMSLSERVEMNRFLLKKMLKTADWLEGQSQEVSTAHICQREPLLLADHNFPGNELIKQGCGTVQSDSDWDSGISLQESEHGVRTFVSPGQLPLSRRHEQAKLLLERARMKARASPLKADHSILPIERSPQDAHVDGSSPPKRGPTSREWSCLGAPGGKPHHGGWEKWSQSPSRVRFEDESIQEAEDCYQLQRRCRAEPSGHRVTRDLPGLPAYRLPRKEGLLRVDVEDAVKARGKAPRPRGNAVPHASSEIPAGAASLPPSLPAFCIDGKCSSCGFYIISEPAVGGLEPPSYEFPDPRLRALGEEVYLPGQLEIPRDPVPSLSVGPGDVVSSLTPRTIPCGALLSGPRITIEPIRETYIGDVTSIDDIPVIGVTACSPGDTEREDCKGTRVTSCYHVVVSGSEGRRAGNVGAPAPHIDSPKSDLGENGAPSDPRTAPADCGSGSRAEMEERGRVCGQQCCGVESTGRLGRCADSSVCVPGVSPEADLNSEQVLEMHSLYKKKQQQLPHPASPCPVGRPDHSPDQSQGVSSLSCLPLPLESGMRGLGNGQGEEARGGPREPETNPALPPNLPVKGCSRHPSLKRPPGSKDKPGSCQQGRVLLTDTDSHITHPGSCPSPQGDAGRPPDTPSLLEASSLHPQRQVPRDHTWASCPSEPGAHPLPDSDPPCLRDPLADSSGQSLGRRTPSMGRLSMATHWPMNPNSGLSPSEYDGSIEVSKTGNSWSSVDVEGMSTSKKTAEKDLSKTGKWTTHILSESLGLWNGRVQDIVVSVVSAGVWILFRNGLLGSKSVLIPHGGHWEAWGECENMVWHRSVWMVMVKAAYMLLQFLSILAERKLPKVRIWPRDNTDRPEEPNPAGASDLRECQGLAQPPEADPAAYQSGNRPYVCRKSPAHHSTSCASEDNQVLIDPGYSPESWRVTESQQRPRSALKAYFSSIGHSAVRKLSKLRSASMEQLSPPSANPQPAVKSSEEIEARLRKNPSLQSLQLASPLAHLRKAISFQSLRPQARRNRSSSYLVQEVPEAGLGRSEAQPPGSSPVMALHGGDFAPARYPTLIGQVTQRFADASFILELSKPAGALFGFHISRLGGRIFIHQLADQNAEKLYTGLLEVGDEILEVNGESVEDLSFTEVNNLILEHSTVYIWIRRHNGTRQSHQQ